MNTCPTCDQDFDRSTFDSDLVQAYNKKTGPGGEIHDIRQLNQPSGDALARAVDEGRFMGAPQDFCARCYCVAFQVANAFDEAEREEGRSE